MKPETISTGTPSPDSIAALIDRVKEAVASPENQARRKREPRVTFSLEDPIASSKVFHYDVNRYYDDPLFYVEQTLRQKLWRWDNFPYDDQSITSDILASLSFYPEYTFIGLGLSFTYEGVPIIQDDHPMTQDPDLALLEPVSFNTSGWMPRVLRWYDAVSALVGDRMNVVFDMTWWRGCLDLAIQLRGYEGFVADTAERPQFIHDLLAYLVEQRCRWWGGYYQHFGLAAEPSRIADDWINVPFVSPPMFRDFVLPQYLEIERYHGGVAAVHSCGNQTPVQRYLLEIKSLPGLEVSAWTDLEQTLVNVPADKRLAISVHPNDVLCATPDEMEAKSTWIAEKCQGRSFGLGTSGVTPLTDDIDAYIAKINQWTQAAHRALEPGPLSEQS